jgi:hypothetical protein
MMLFAEPYAPFACHDWRLSLAEPIPENHNHTNHIIAALQDTSVTAYG